MRSDGELLRDHLAGDTEAFPEFYRRHRRPLFAYLLDLVHVRESAEDLLQDVFVTVIERAESLTKSDDLRPFLFVTARNKAIDCLRRVRRRTKLLEKAPPQIFRSATVPPADAAGPDAERLNAALAELPQPQRETVLLKVAGGFTFEEIGALTGVPAKTAASRYRYGIEKLKKYLLQAEHRYGN